MYLVSLHGNFCLKYPLPFKKKYSYGYTLYLILKDAVKIQCAFIDDNQHR